MQRQPVEPVEPHDLVEQARHGDRDAFGELGTDRSTRGVYVGCPIGERSGSGFRCRPGCVCEGVAGDAQVPWRCEVLRPGCIASRSTPRGHIERNAPESGLIRSTTSRTRARGDKPSIRPRRGVSIGGASHFRCVSCTSPIRYVPWWCSRTCTTGATPRSRIILTSR